MTWNQHVAHQRAAFEMMGLAPPPAALAFDFVEAPKPRKVRCRAPHPATRIEAPRARQPLPIEAPAPAAPPAPPRRPYSFFAGRALSAGERAFKAESDRIQAETEHLRPREAPDDCRPGMPLGLRPCPWVSCRNHLGVTVNDAGSLKVDHGTLDFTTLSDTCAIDVARRHPEGISQEAAGDKTGVTKDRVRQIERKLRARLVRKVRKISTEWSPADADGRETCVPCRGTGEDNGIDCMNCDGDGYRWRTTGRD